MPLSRYRRRSYLAGCGMWVVALVAAAPSAGDLAGSYQRDQQRAGALQSTVSQDSRRIQGYEGTIGSLQVRLAAVQRSVAIQQRLLRSVRGALSRARARLRALHSEYVRGRRLLAGQLRADYESPPPTIVGVIVNAQGFDDLLNQVNDLRALERRNARVIALVRDQRSAVAQQARRLGLVEARRARAAAAVLVERDQVAQLRLSIVDRELAAVRERRRASAQLAGLRQRLSREASVLDAQAAAAQSSSGGPAAAAGSCADGPFVAHGGDYGFFPAAGTDYSTGQEPLLAARLDALGRALQLHLVGISGYRSPQHSVEVGGFADDPHTQGNASDTPGVEGVPEATLERFCLTRPFGGPREADHIQPL